jgi:elongator complex protein 1
LYRLDVALLVAQKSQKDPREYMPFLQSLLNMEAGLSHFTIDDYLKRYDSALIHLATTPTKSFDDALAYIKKHRLFKKGMELYKDNRRQYDV